MPGSFSCLLRIMYLKDSSHLGIYILVHVAPPSLRQSAGGAKTEPILKIIYSKGWQSSSDFNKFWAPNIEQANVSCQTQSYCFYGTPLSVHNLDLRRVTTCWRQFECRLCSLYQVYGLVMFPGIGIQGVDSEHPPLGICCPKLWKQVRFDIADIARTVRGGTQSKSYFDPDGPPQWIRTKHLSQGRNDRIFYSHHADHTAVVAMQAKKWPICFQGR